MLDIVSGSVLTSLILSKDDENSVDKAIESLKFAILAYKLVILFELMRACQIFVHIHICLDLRKAEGI